HAPSPRAESALGEEQPAREQGGVALRASARPELARNGGAVVEQQRERPARGTAPEAWNRSLEGDDSGEVAGARPDGSGDGVQLGLALLVRAGPPARSNP